MKERPPTLMTYKKLQKRWREDKLRRQRRSAELKSAIKRKGPTVFRRYAIQKAILFGSVLDERCDNHSDIDLLVTPLASEEYGALRRDLESAFSAPVDLHTDRDDPQFVSKIKERGEIIFEI